MKYYVVQASKVNELEVKVNSLMQQGWQPIGGIDSSKQDMGTEYYQAMIYSPAPKPPGMA